MLLVPVPDASGVLHYIHRSRPVTIFGPCKSYELFDFLWSDGRANGLGPNGCVRLYSTESEHETRLEVFAN